MNYFKILKNSFTVFFFKKPLVDRASILVSEPTHDLKIQQTHKDKTINCLKNKKKK